MGFWKSLFSRKSDVDDWIRGGSWCRCNNCGQEWWGVEMKDEAGLWEPIIPDRCALCGVVGYVVQIPAPADR